MKAGAGIAALLVVAGLLWYFSSSAPLVDLALPSAEQATTSDDVVSKPAVTKKPSAPSATQPTAAPPAASSKQFCPKFGAGVQLGSTDGPQDEAWARGDVANLQAFLARRYNLNEKEFVDSIFGANTESYLKRYQREEGLPQTGVLEYGTQQRILGYCLNGLMANGGIYPSKNFTFAVGGVTQTLFVHEALLETQGTILNGAFRVELISVTGTTAKIRVTGRVIGGLQSQTLSLGKGEEVVTQHWPIGLKINVQSLTSSSAVLAISQQPTD